ncbi:MAG TPA: sensor histidine kinase [Longimicrobium sp.]
MSATRECPLAATLAQRMRAGREELVERWLGRIAERVTLQPNDIFPTDELLNHVPLLIDGIARYLEDPADEITADTPVVAKAVELGELRHTQGFDAHQILREYEILGGVLFDFLIHAADEVEEPCERGELLVCGHRVFRSIAVIQQYTTTHFLRLADDRMREREDRLRGFNRAVTHELKNRIGAAGGALEMLAEDWVAEDPKQRTRFVDIATRNVNAMKDTLATLLELSRIDPDGTPARNILLSDVAGEVRRQLREFADARGVEVQIADDLPVAEVPAAPMELALSNYVSNAIKYRDPSEPRPWARIEGELRKTEGGSEIVVRVCDNGLGVPLDAREQLFTRFFRAHEGTVTGEEGTGLGLSLVREAIEAAGGKVWFEFPDRGSVFALSVPRG